MTLDFQSYLASIRTTYAKWWEYYTLTDATGKQRQSREDSPFFDFGLMVQTVKREERDRQTEEKVERFSVLDGLRKYSDQQVLLVGRPGSGKSTALARLMLEEATNQQARIPVLVELRYWQGSIDQLIRDSLIRHEMPAEQVEAALKNALILFDGVNELPSEEARSQLSAFRRNHLKLPMIFTTRDLSIGGDLGIEKQLEMQPLSEDQMREFVRAYVPEQAEQMLRQLKDRLRELGQTPLLLWMLCSLFQQTGKIPENLGLVFREFTQGYERYLKEDVRIESDKAWWKPVLQQLAWVMMQGEKPTEFRVAIAREEAVRAIAQFLDQKVPYAEDVARKCLRDLQKHHLIQVGTNLEELEFRHQLIQEYYAAEALSEQLPYLTEDELKQNYLNYLKWTEPLALMLATVEDETMAIRMVRWALEVDRVLGARLAGEVKLEFQEETVGLVDAQEVPIWLKIQLLGETRSDNVVFNLSGALASPDSSIRRRAVFALRRINSDTAILGLIKALKDADLSIRRSAIKGLGDSKSAIAIPHLLDSLAALGHANEYEDLAIVEALKNIDPKIEIPFLKKCEAFESYQSSVFKLMALVLRKTSAEGIVEAFLEVMTNQDDSTCREIAKVFNGISSQVIASDLLKFIDHSNPKIRESAVMALRQINSALALPGLLKAIKDSEPKVSRRAAFALGEIGSDEVVPSLIEALEDYRISDGVLYVLQSIGSKTVVISLLQALEHQDSHIRWQAAHALGEIGSKEAIPALLKASKDSDPDTFYSSVCALGKLDYEPAIPMLERLIEGELPYTDVPSKAVEALGKIQSKKVIPILLKALQTGNNETRMKAAEVLGQVRAKTATPNLVQAIEDKDSWVRRHAIDSLEAIFEEKEMKDSVTQHLSHLLTLIPTNAGEDVYGLILAIQKNCKYYNYKIYQDYLEAQKHDRQTLQNSDRSHPTTIIYPNVTEVKQTIMSNSSKYSFPNAQKVQIFEQVNTYIENNHSTDPEIKTAIADLTLLLTQLQTQNPQVTTESQALTVLDAEFTEIQHSTTHPLVTLRQQLLNPERHLQAIKATLAEIAKHYLEESVWSKAAITYLDKMSETPDQGA
jgi:HEAT repeat protein